MCRLDNSAGLRVVAQYENEKSIAKLRCIPSFTSEVDFSLVKESPFRDGCVVVYRDNSLNSGVLCVGLVVNIDRPSPLTSHRASDFCMLVVWDGKSKKTINHTDVLTIYDKIPYTALILYLMKEKSADSWNSFFEWIEDSTVSDVKDRNSVKYKPEDVVFGITTVDDEKRIFLGLVAEGRHTHKDGKRIIPHTHLHISVNGKIECVPKEGIRLHLHSRRERAYVFHSQHLPDKEG